MAMAEQQRFLTFSRPLLLLCAGILLAVVVSALLCQHLIVESLHNRTAQYGRALADLAARQAMDATLNHDLVSLQVILSDIAENPDVANATIHDVENNLLVQAGQAPDRARPEANQRYFTAPITLHNSIAGYVTVSLDLASVIEVEYEIYWLFGFMAVLLIALTLSTLYFGRSWNLPLAIPRPAIPIVDSPPGPEPDHATGPKAFPRVELVVQFRNLKELSGQLDSRAFRNVSRRIEEQFKGILALYSGQLIQLNGEEARIAFANPEVEPDAAFQAVCSAKLLATLNARTTQFPLRIGAMIVQRDSDSTILKNLQYQLAESDEYQQLLTASADGSLLMEKRLIGDGVSSKVCQQPLDDFDDVVVITALNEQYEELLERQLARLQRLQ